MTKTAKIVGIISKNIYRICGTIAVSIFAWPILFLAPIFGVVMSYDGYNDNDEKMIWYGVSIFLVGILFWTVFFKITQNSF